MKRKMLISITLIMIMLLNCIMPLFSVNAVEGEEIQLNSNLYKAVKSSLNKQGISYSTNDVTHTLTLSSDVKASITELNLNESAISDLTGLDAFSGLTHLELSGNNLTSESNLSVLNNLPLNYLDLSTNQLEDVSAISGLITKLQSTGTIILSNQRVTSVQTVFVDSEEGSDNEETATFELPAILELAGYIKSCWKSTRSISEREGGIAPFLSIDGIPMYVNSETHTVEVNICSEAGNGYYGLLEVVIYIYDDATEAASAKNPNKAAENILNGSEFKLYYVVHDKSSEAITTMDTNLYYAIKEQLTAGQKVNSELASYPYAVDLNGNIIYEKYTYTTQTIGGTEYRVLKNVESGIEEYLYDASTKTLYKYENGTKGSIVNTSVEDITVTSVDNDGNITSKAGYKIAFVSDDANQTLYIQAYDDAKTFVIDDSVLTNKITSLILNNKQIRDLSGLEYFIGLSSKLNVSHNYLSDIDPLYDMETQKDSWEKQIVEQYTKWLKGRSQGSLSSATAKVKTAHETIKKNSEAITDSYKRILNLLAEAADVDITKEKYQEDLQSKVSSINTILDGIYGSTDEEGNYKAGYWDLIQGYTADGEYYEGAVDELNSNISNMYNYLETLYTIYNEEYKLTTLLSSDVNYTTYAEYQTYDNAIHESAESAKSLLNNQISFLKTLESQKALSDLDKELLTKAFGINFNTTKTETPLAEYFDEYMSENNLSRTQAVSVLNTIREVAIYSEMANYCLIKRMNEDTAAGYCYEEKYLEKRIKEFEIEDIDTSIEESILEAITDGSSYSTLYDVYKAYTEKTYNYTNENSEVITLSTCKGDYVDLDEISVQYTPYTSAELIAAALDAAKSGAGIQANVEYVLNSLGARADKIINTVDLYEIVTEGTDYTGDKNILFLYNQMYSLSNKLLNGDIDRYIKLPRLKDLDVSYNADLNNIERISELTSLYTLDASYCYIADVSNVDWASMENLKNLSLAYNYISDISPITNLPNLKTLNLSNNLISGKLDIAEEQFQKLFKNMEEFNIAGNQITDIESLLIYLDYISGGNYANYLVREDTIDIDLRNQKIELVINDTIDLADHPATIDVELPKIFTQLLAIDTARTAFGETSQSGRIESEGKYVTLNTRTAGDKKGEVVVLAMSGNGEEVDTCVGEGTTATIYYTVTGSIQTNPDNTNTTNPDNTNTVNPDNTVDPDDTNTTNPDNTVDPDDTNTTNPDNTVNPDDTNTINPDNTNTVEDPAASATVVDRATLGYEKENDYLTSVNAKTPLNNFKTIFLNGLEYTVEVSKDGSEVNSGYMATGMEVKLVDENGNTAVDAEGKEIVYQVVVKGDINGDGYANSLDTVLIKAHRNDIQVLTGPAFEAGDINSDGTINITDAKLLLYHRAEVTDYDLNFKTK